MHCYLSHESAQGLVTLGASLQSLHYTAMVHPLVCPIRGHELVRRRDLLPDEPDHPRADEGYYKLQLGPLKQLELPIYSLRWRRITFIEISWDRFTAATDKPHPQPLYCRS
jgi:hypothetical protein